MTIARITRFVRPVFLLMPLLLAAGCQPEGGSAPDSVPAPLADSVETPQQAFDRIIECAALLAVHESATRGELSESSAAFSLITHGLGKAQEHAQQAGIDTAQVQRRYGEQTLVYFSRHAQGHEQFLQETAATVTACETRLRQYEPGAQIEDALRQARELAR